MLQASDSVLRKYLLYRIGKIENEAGVGLPFDKQQEKNSHYWRIVTSRDWWIFRRVRRNCLCSVLMSVRDGQWLGVLDSVSVTVRCLVSGIHGEVCRLGYRLAGRHVERSVTTLVSSSSNNEQAGTK